MTLLHNLNLKSSLSNSLQNNVENMKTQRLIIKGPVSSFTRVMAYRDNGDSSTLNYEKGY